MVVLFIEDVCPSILRLVDNFDHFRAMVDHLARDGVIQAVLLLGHIHAVLNLPDYDGRNALPGMDPSESILLLRQNYILEQVVFFRLPSRRKAIAIVVLWLTFPLHFAVFDHFCEILVDLHEYGCAVNDELEFSIRRHTAIKVEKLNILRLLVISFVVGVAVRNPIVVEGAVAFELKSDLVVFLVHNGRVLERPLADGHAQGIAIANHCISVVFVGGHVDGLPALHLERVSSHQFLLLLLYRDDIELVNHVVFLELLLGVTSQDFLFFQF